LKLADYGINKNKMKPRQLGASGYVLEHAMKEVFTLTHNGMKQQRVLVTGNDYAVEIQHQVDTLLEEGWLVVSVTAQHIASSTTNTVRGGYFIVFERKNNKP
jgi:tRNA G18 (ribose-2'-O)-methylase SpoU